MKSSIKIAILSFSFLKPKHIQRLKQLGEVVEFSSTRNLKDAIERIGDSEVVIADCWDVPMDKNFFKKISKVKYISLNSTGFNQVDIESAKAHGVMIANVPGFSTEAVAEQTIGLIFAVARHLPKGNREMSQNPFQIDPANRDHDAYKGFELKGKTLGIFGLGQIGTRVAEIGNALGMRVIANSRNKKSLKDVEWVDFENLLIQSDFLSINSAFFPEGKNLFNKETLSKMKPEAILVNTARGDFVDEGALKEAIESDKIFGYGADVLVDWSKDNPLLGMDRIVLTPHSAFFTEESLENMADIIVENIESYASGDPINVVNS